MPSPLTANSAKLDARGPLLGNFALLETPQLQNALSESQEVQIGLTEVLETPKTLCRSVISVRAFFRLRHRSAKIFGIIGSVEQTSSVGHPLVYTTHNDAMTCCSLSKLDIQIVL